MKIAIVNNMVPFVYGGAEFLADGLAKKLKEFGHEAQVIRLPFAWDTPVKIADSMMAVRLTKLINADKVIALKFPAYYIEHENKTLWLVHQFRQVYDLADTQYAIGGVGEEIKTADNNLFSGLPGKIFTISDVVSERLKKFNGFDSQALYPPLMDEAASLRGEYGDYFFCPGRVNDSKRQALAVEAMRCVKSGVKLIIAGKGDTAGDEEKIFRLIEENSLGEKVKYFNRFISQQEKEELYANSLGTLFIPYDEDYGYVSLESLSHAKAVVSCSDSGGTAIFVRNGYTGYIAEPQPEALAKAMDDMYGNKKKTIEMGNNCIEHLGVLDISWENVIGRLLG